MEEKQKSTIISTYDFLKM